jgi:ferredoxin--NADP+ reductase
MDVARILARSPEELASTDIADHALARLRASNVREVILLGRRGPAQAAFTHPELMELAELAGVDLVVNPEEVAADPSQEEALADRNVGKNVAALRRLAEVTEHAAKRRIIMRFLTSPVEILGEDGRVKAIRVEKNRLVAGADGAVRAEGTGVFEELPVGMVFRSIGYRGKALPGVPFDERSGTIPNQGGRVMRGGERVAGEYVVGWAKRGPTGVIGTNKPDSAATVAAMMEDLAQLPLGADEDRDPLATPRLLEARGCDYVTYDEWGLLDRAEIDRGAPQSRPRVKFTKVEEMLSYLGERRAPERRRA